MDEAVDAYPVERTLLKALGLAAESDALDRMREALAALPTRQRAVLKQLYHEKFPPFVVGQRLNLSPAAVARERETALGALRQVMAPDPEP